MRNTRNAAICILCMLAVAVSEWHAPSPGSWRTSLDQEVSGWCARVYRASDLGKVLADAERAAKGE